MRNGSPLRAGGSEVYELMRQTSMSFFCATAATESSADSTRSRRTKGICSSVTEWLSSRE